MIKCPMCRDIQTEDARTCRKCQTDLTLLADYVTHLRGGLDEAEKMTRAGELGEAVWAYLSVLEIDPDNSTARRQVGKVVTAVRQFDETATGRRWMRTLQKENRLRRWLTETGGGSWVFTGLFLLLFAGLISTYVVGYYAGRDAAKEADVKPEEKKEKDKMPKEKRDKGEMGG